MLSTTTALGIFAAGLGFGFIFGFATQPETAHRDHSLTRVKKYSDRWTAIKGDKK